MRRILFAIICIALLLPVALAARQESAPELRAEITGVNASDFPTVTVTANVYDRVGEPVFGLTAENFSIVGELVDRGQIVSVENISDDGLTFSVVLVIDTSSSMAELPLERAKEAATSFINSIGPSDPVAIVTFGSQTHLIQDFTTDKNVLLNAINNLGYGGKTRLYDAGLLGVRTAADSGSSRRAVILLSDGAEFGGLSNAAREAAVTEGLIRGVPVYTIGLGYGVDRSYLEELSEGTSARFYESPTPDELLEIYQSLAATLRSQYVITLTVDLPSDGSTYELGIQATSGDASAIATATLRTPIPVPVITLPALPAEPITEPTEVTAAVESDDGITSAEFTVNGVSLGEFTEPPYTITLDPVTLPPGENTLTFSATDATGDTTVASAPFQVAALPSTVTVVGLPDVDLTQPQTITLEVTGQTPGASATYSVDGGEGIEVTAAPFSFILDPYTLTPGEHTLSVDLVNQGGVTTTVDAGFMVGEVPPIINLATLEDLTAGQVVTEITTVTIPILASQSPISEAVVSVGDVAVPVEIGDDALTATIDPALLPLGPATLSLTVTDGNGQSVSGSLDFEVGAAAPQVTINGLQPGETLDADREITVDVTSQTPVGNVTYTIDGTQLATQDEAPFSLNLDILAIGPGEHILTVSAANDSGQSGSSDVAFVVAEGPSLTATALVPTSTPTSTTTPTVNRTENAAATQQAQDANATATAGAQLIEVMTQQAESASEAEATRNAEATINAQLTASAEATTEAQFEATTEAQNLTATAEAQLAEVMTAQADSASQAEATRNAEATTVAQAAVTEEGTPGGSPAPTLTPVTLTSETQASGAVDNNVVLLAVICAAVVALLVVIYFVTRRRQQRQDTR